jgi:excinuclease ABC subunit B
MQRAIEETRRRRELQEAYNREHGITPETIKKSIRAGIEAEAAAHQKANAIVGRGDEVQYITDEYISELETEMFAAAEALEFERAAAIRDRIERLRDSVGKPVHEVDYKKRDDNEEGDRRGRRRRGSRVPRPKRNV